MSGRRSGDHDFNLPDGPRLGRIAGQLDVIVLQLETMAQAQSVADGELLGDLTVRLLQLQHSVLEARERAAVAVAAVNAAALDRQQG
jgi:hypothetical protein